MTEPWQDILTQQQALDSNDNSSISRSYIPLPQLSVLEVSGEEAKVFLQNLLTNDVFALEDNQSQLNGFCNVKGRLFALFLLIHQQNSYQIVLPKSMSANLLQRLSMYILRSKVSITDKTDDSACIGLTQYQADSNDLSAFTISPYQQQQNRSITIIPQSQLPEFIASVQQQYQLESDKSWQLLDIDAGLPMVFIDTKEQFTPQQINLDLVGGVSFSKGCYPGQEIVARLHYLGKPSRRLFNAEISATNCPTVGQEVMTNSNSVAGHIVCAEQLGTKIKLLLSLKLAEVDSDLSIDSNPISLSHSDLG